MYVGSHNNLRHYNNLPELTKLVGRYRDICKHYKFIIFKQTRHDLLSHYIVSSTEAENFVSLIN